MNVSYHCVICTADSLAPTQPVARRGSRIPDDDDDEVSKYFRIKPQNQVVVEGKQTECYVSM